ncbi:MAG: alpha/beta fold hydrolase [Propionibacteriaceae bacterium]
MTFNPMTAGDDARRTDVVLVAGLWLTAAAWDDVITELVRLGHRAVVAPVLHARPGTAAVDLDTQLAALLDTIDALERPVVVGHSAAGTLAWLAADRRPTGVARVVMVGGFPATDGGAYADFFPIVDGQMSFPGWEPFDGRDADDLDDDARRRFVDAAIPVPEGVARGTVRLTDERRFDVPVTVVCPEYGPDEARAWVDGGDVPELARATDVTYVNIDSGHWPMITRPTKLAELLSRVAR